MGNDQGSGFEWRRKRGRVNRTLERIEDIPYNLLSRRGAITDSAKRKLYEEGIPGQALILKAPGERSISTVGENLGRFRVRVEIPDRDPYEVDVTQSFQGGYESEGLVEGALVECRVDRKNPKRVLLIAPEPDERRLAVMESGDILAQGNRATATVTGSEPLGRQAPGTDDEFYVLRLELRSNSEPKPWPVQIGQRVPKGAEEMVAAGRELSVGYLEVDQGDSVAVDWPESSGGRFS
jgi:hypothetical protein